MRYGYFDDSHREYVITRPDTPTPWINYLGSEALFGIISNTAGGYTFYQDARLQRLTRYRYNNVPLDSGGRYIYLRDQDSKQFWSPTWQPIRREVQNYTCRHGLGYTRIASESEGIASEILYFIPLGQNLEIWQMTIRNKRPSAARLSAFASVEFCLWDALDDSTNYQRNYNIGEVEIEPGVIYHKTEYRERRNHFAYFACSEPTAGYDTQREVFLGPYRGWDQPAAVERGSCSNSVARGWAPVGVHQVDLTLEAGEMRQVIFLLGYQQNPQNEKFDPPGSQSINKRAAKQIITQYLKKASVDTAYQDLCDRWNSLLGVFQVDTPDLHTNRMVNIWNAYQCMITFNMSRSASLYESGIGRGMGFRDSNQDLLGFVHMVQERARQRIIDLASTQLPSGGAYHQYQPLTRRGNDAVGSNFNDDPLWLILSVAAYIKESGDWGILEVQVPYDNQAGTETRLYEHLQRSLRYTLDRLGPHGLPLIGRADWNDCLNLNCFSDSPGQSFQTTTNKEGKVAESIFIAGLFVMAAKELADIAHKKGLGEEANQYLQAARTMEAQVYESGWDGRWFLRAYDDAGEPVGSETCKEGQIFIEPQGMCIMAGIGVEDGRARQALDSVRERLATTHGIVLHQPPYTHYYLNLGEISSYPPGYKENGSVFCHTNPWIMVAEAMVGNGDQAYDYYLRINPSAREEISDVHRCEPYVYAQTIAGKDAPTFGEAKNSWLTGTAAWNYVAITHWILGIRPTFDGLQISPAIPESWPGFKVERRFRGVTYHIEVERKDGTRTPQLMVDGKEVKGCVIPLPGQGIKEVTVRVII